MTTEAGLLMVQTKCAGRNDSAGEKTFLTEGSLVLSLAGRDAGRILIVVAAQRAGPDSQIVRVADGKLRRIEKPKIKKLRHLRPLPLPTVAIPKTNREAAAYVREAEKALHAAENRNASDSRQLFGRDAVGIETDH